MGTYLNPPEDARKGRPIKFGSFKYMTMQLEPREVLVGLYDRVKFKAAPHIYSANELEEFEKQYRRGILVSHEFYAVKKWW